MVNIIIKQKRDNCMRESVIKAVFKSDIKKVWDVVTNNEEYTWRSDLSKVVISEMNKEFVEYTEKGFQTTFKITKYEPYYQYGFSIKNQTLVGRWNGLFKETETGGTMIIFTEEYQFHNPILTVLSYAIRPVEKMQKTYIDDLRKALGE